MWMSPPPIPLPFQMFLDLCTIGNNVFGALYNDSLNAKIQDMFFNSS